MAGYFSPILQTFRLICASNGSLNIPLADACGRWASHAGDRKSGAMMDQYKITIDVDGRQDQATAFIDHFDSYIYLMIAVNGIRYEKLDHDCLSAFNFIRENCFADVTFLCNGARRNYVLSGMAQQAGGFVGYLVRLGQPSSLDDTGFIFDPCPRDEIGSVGEQAAFKTEWFQSMSGPA